MTSTLKVDELQNSLGGSDIKVGSLKHPDASGTNITLASDGTTTVSGALTASGGIANAGTISAGTIGTSVIFPTRSDFGIIEIFESGDPVIGRNQSQDFSYTAGQRYFVMCNGEFGTITNGLEFYDISTSNSVTQLKSHTALVTPSIPSSGTLRITVGDASARLVFAVLLVRMNH